MNNEKTLNSIAEKLDKINALLENNFNSNEFDLEFTSKGQSVIDVIFSTPIKKDNRKVALKLLTTYYSIPNINDSNNIFQYSYNINNSNNVEWRTVKLETGSYELKSITDKIEDSVKSYYVYNDEDSNTLIKENSSSIPSIKIRADPSTMKCIIEVPSNMKVNFGVENSVGSILGFSNQILESGLYVSDYTVDINPLNTIRVHCSLVKGCYQNGEISQTIYTFAPKVAPGFKIIEEPRQLTFYELIGGEMINSLRIWLTDQDNKIVDLRDEQLTIVLTVKG